jgi:hypothetical protein
VRTCPVATPLNALVKVRRDQRNARRVGKVTFMRACPRLVDSTVIVIVCQRTLAMVREVRAGENDPEFDRQLRIRRAFAARLNSELDYSERKTMRVTFRIPLLWTLLLALSFACVLAFVVAWFILLSTICSNPRTPVPQTEHVISYNCHGMTVFISPLQDAILHWDVPIGFLFILLSFVAGAMVVQAVAKTWLSDVHGRRVRIVAVPPGEAPQWVREKWVGLELPLAQFSTGARRLNTAGVLTGPRGFLATLGRLFRGELRKHSGFSVNVLEAVAVLERVSPEAAQWWRTNAAHLMKPTRCFLFPEHVCTVVE